jgi:ubiquinol-cytochrome c reductase cytochrome b subunit
VSTGAPPKRPRDPLVQPVRFVDERLGAAKGIRFLMDYVFPDHWSFMLGEIALYCFVVLVLTGVYLAVFFNDSMGTLVYHGSYLPLRGQEMTEAYYSAAILIPFHVSGGLLVRQTHHWAADVFLAAITVHLVRIAVTGAFRKPRDINYYIGVTMAALVLLEAFCGYMLPQDFLSGMGLIIAWAVAMSLPLVGGPLSTALWGGKFPGSGVIEPRLFIAHVFILPAIIGALIAVHLAIIMTQHHSQFRGPGRREENVVGTPMWPGYALRSLGLFAAVGAVLFLLGGLIQINPIWLWGPYHTWMGTNGAQPDWYLGWLIGALRMMPNWEISVAGHTLVPNPFWGGALYPLLLFVFLYALPSLDRRLFTKDSRRHELLDRPRDNPRRTALVAAVLSNIALTFWAGAADRMFFRFHMQYEGTIWFFRGAFFVLPVATYIVTKAVCERLRRSGAHPLREWSGSVISRNGEGGFDVLDRGDAGAHLPRQPHRQRDLSPPPD